MDAFVPFEVIAQAQAGLPVRWTERELVNLAHQRGTPLPLIRRAGRTSEALWNVQKLCDFWARRYHSEPAIVETFCARIRTAASAADNSKRAKAKAA